MSRPAAAAKRLAVLASLCLPMAFAGCGETVQFEGRVFDMLGVNDTTKRRDNAVAERAPLVLPPNQRALPQPGSIAAAAGQDVNWPDDPDERRRAAAKTRQKKKLDASKAVEGRDVQPGLLDRMMKGKQAQQEEEVEAVPSPEAGDPQVVR